MIWLDLLIDALLVAGFGVQHSVFAMIRTKGIMKSVTNLDPLSWRGPQSLINATYVVLAAAAWRPVDIVLWELTGPAYWASMAVLLAGWLWYFQIHLFEYDLGMAFGCSGIISRSLKRPLPKPEMWKVGTRRWIRFPVHTAFFPMFLAFPTMTADLLVFGVVANVYNWIGTVLYDRRLVTLVGKPYLDYIKQTGLIFPPVFRNPAGAASMALPAPRMWSRPSRNLAGVFLGVLAGAGYWMVLGVLERTPGNLFLAWGSALLVAVAGGVALGLIKLGRFMEVREEGFDDFQSELAVNAGLLSAVGIITWFAASATTARSFPTLTAVLPLWITVLWIGHATGAGVTLLGRSVLSSARQPQFPVP